MSTMKSNPLRESNDARFLDPDLAVLLTKLASLKGFAIPASRFGMMTRIDNKDVMDFDRIDRAKAWWRLAIPGASAEELNKIPLRTDLPLLWIQKNGDHVFLVKGILSSGKFVCEYADGRLGQLSVKQVKEGYFIDLQVDESKALDGKGPERAIEYFYQAIRKRARQFIEPTFATSVVNILALCISFFTMQVYDRVVPTQAYSTLTVLTIGVLIAILFELILKQTRSHSIDRVCKVIDEELSGIFFAKALDIRMDARPKTVGTFAAQIKHFELVRTFMTSSTLFLFADAPYVLFFVFVIYLIAGSLALIPLILLPVSLLIGLYGKWRISHLAEAQLKEATIKNGLLVESIDGIEAIKAVGAEWKVNHMWQKLNAEASERELEIRRVSTFTNNFSQIVQQLAYVGLIVVGVYEINAGHITTGALMACSIITNRALAPIMQISGLMVQWQHVKGALKGLDDIMARPADHPVNQRMLVPETCKAELELKDASFAYSDSTTALMNASMSFRAGEKVAILGPVGSGKSTLLKLLSTLYKPQEGVLLLDGVDVFQVAPEYLREKIGYLPQEVRLFNGTLRDNLIIGLASPNDEQILAACAKTGLDRIIKAHPQGLNLKIAEGGLGLSGGQKQLAALTRMLIAQPKILILDEPTASMDNDTEAFIMKNLLTQLLPDTLVIYATHKVGLIHLAERLIILGQGKVILDGPREEVLAKIRKPRVVNSNG